ncbi:MAG: excinuclease ABC subunit UvrC, partial [Planctomycetota bacterium]
MAPSKKPRLEKGLKSLPDEPGVYRFLDRNGDVLYVGKAKNLKKRVRSYFRPSGKGDGRTFFEDIVGETVDLRVIVTDTEKEALLLENNLIKKHRPRYNLVFRDDKSFLSLRLTVSETFPRIHAVRRIRRDGARYFGPFASASALRETLSLVRTRFPLRTCSPSFFANRSRPCIRYEIRQCTGPCCGRISEANYRAVVREATLFLEGKIPELLKTLRGRMMKEADTLNFEEAARLRDAARAVEKTLEKQHVEAPDLEDRDVFGLYRAGEDLALAILFVREGRVVGSSGQAHPGFPRDEEAIAATLMQFYSGERRPPPSILVPLRPPNAEVLEEVLSERRGGPVKLAAPKRGPKRALLAMAGKNAAYTLAHSDRSARRRALGLEDLRERLALKRAPHRIECFDASHLTGKWAVGAMAVFVGGAPAAKEYRMYRIRTPGAEDDFTMMG